MTDRAVELAAAIMLCGRDAISYSVACEKLLNKWQGEDMERSVAPKTDREKQWDRDDMVQRLSTALEQLGIAVTEAGAAKHALRDCLSQMGYKNLSDAELQWEAEQGNQRVQVIQRARAILADAADAKVKEEPKPDGPVRPRCETCMHWDNSTSLGGTGLCRGTMPERDKMTGKAVWPISNDTDSCPHHNNPSDF